MSGHSKWSTIKRQKQAKDSQKGLAFSKLARLITIAARENSEARLRLAVEKARAANMPKENIDRAIERGKGSEAAALQEVVFEGFGPGGVAIVVETASDNHIRTMQSLKAIFEQAGGSLGGKGSVTFLFNKLGLITLEPAGTSMDKLIEEAIAAGALDINQNANGAVSIFTPPEKLHQIREYFANQGLPVSSAQLFYRPISTVVIDDKQTRQKILSLVETLEEHEDVQNVYLNSGDLIA